MIRRSHTHIIAITAMILAALLLTAIPAFAQEGDGLQMTLKSSDSDAGVLLKSANVDGAQYFFLPSGVKEENMERAFGEGADYKTMQSANIGSVHFFSSDPEKGMDYVHQSKDNNAPGQVYMYDKNFRLIYQGKVDALKGRGNSTWDYTDKKSYQMKLNKKADLLDPAGGSQKAKKWLLLANPYDPTLMRNYLAYNLAKEIGLENSPEGRPVDVYYDGQYRGSYYLCEKVEIGEGRVEVDDLEKEVENANPGLDFGALEETIVNKAGIDMKFEKGIKAPQDITGGYLLELDSVFYSDEKSWFSIQKHGIVVSKSPEFLPENMLDYIAGIYRSMYDYVEGEYDNFGEGERLAEYIDLDSFARFFLINEWFCNNDAWTSSTYFNKPKGDDHLYAGPVWDFDASMRNRNEDKIYDVWFAPRFGGELLAIPAFRQKMQEVYLSEMKPAVEGILLGESSGAYLKPAKVMKAELAPSVAMNYMIWDINDCIGSYLPKPTVEENYDEMMTWMQNRAKWFDKEITSPDFVPNKYDITQVQGVQISADVSKRICSIGFRTAEVRCRSMGREGVRAASDYQIAYRKAGSGSWKTVATGGERSFQLKNLTRGEAYEVKVRAASAAVPEPAYGGYSAEQRFFLQKTAPSVKAGKKAVTVKWAKAAKTSRYQIRIATNKSFNDAKTLNVKASAAHKKTIRNLRSGKNYYIQMRCCKTVKGKDYYGKWSAVKTVRVK